MGVLRLSAIRSVLARPVGKRVQRLLLPVHKVRPDRLHSLPLVRMVVHVHHRRLQVPHALPRMPTVHKQRLAVHEDVDFHHPGGHSGVHVIAVRGEEHLLVVHRLVPLLGPRQPRGDPVHEPHRPVTRLQVKQTGIHGKHPHGLRVPRPAHTRVVDAVVPPVRGSRIVPVAESLHVAVPVEVIERVSQRHDVDVGQQHRVPEHEKLPEDVELLRRYPVVGLVPVRQRLLLPVPVRHPELLHRPRDLLVEAYHHVVLHLGPPHAVEPGPEHTVIAVLADEGLVAHSGEDLAVGGDLAEDRPEGLIAFLGARRRGSRLGCPPHAGHQPGIVATHAERPGRGP
mmetsp:Transcript_4094/g.18567  ORF Transcript_4094/g.18567 Transcript_4094/m.18567 type:complete len:340 (+) Transcript_4094:4182-5201(+)